MAERRNAEVEEFVQRWSQASKTLRARLLRRGVSASDADDILQDVALRLFRSEHFGGTSMEHFEAMAWTTAKWALADRLRASMSRGISVEPEALEREGPYESPNLAARIDFERAWERLTERERRVLELRSGGEPDAVIARELQVSEPAIRMIARRARLKLAEDLL